MYFESNICGNASVLEDIRVLQKIQDKLNSKTIPVLPSLDPSLIFPFHILRYPIYPTGFSSCFFSSFLAIFILLSSNNSSFFWEKLSSVWPSCMCNEWNWLNVYTWNIYIWSVCMCTEKESASLFCMKRNVSCTIRLRKCTLFLLF